MTFSRVVAVGLLLVAAGCFEPPEQCDSLTCAGCCDASGACQPGGATAACGVSGATCSACTAGQVCSAGECRLGDTGGGGGTVSCDAPSIIDFGRVARGTTRTLTIDVVNHSSGAMAATASLNASNGFSISPSGNFDVPARSEQQVTVTFAATTLGTVTGALLLQRGSSCPATTITLRAEVLESVLVVVPTEVDFGYVAVNVTGTKMVTLTNLGDTPIAVSGLTVSGGFGLVDVASFSIPGNDSKPVALTFRPTTLGPRLGAFNFSTDLPAARHSVALRGTGGGPVISVDSPLLLPATSFPGAQTAQLVVRNVGTRPVPADPEGNLRFLPGAFEVRPLGATSLSEFLVELPSSYDPAVGVLAGESVRLDVTFTPTSPGPKSIEVTLFTNDVATPAAVVIINAEALAATPCSYSVSPTTIDFGRVRRGTSLDWPVTITNTGITGCTLLDANVVNGATFFSRDGFAGGVLAPGASTRLTARFTAPAVSTASGAVAGTLRVSTSSVTAPQTDVVLNASTGPDCLLVTPRVDFGGSAVGCRSASRSISVLNTCATSVQLGAAAVASPSGLSSADFTLTNGGARSLPAKSLHEYAVSYRPANVGEEDAMLIFESTQAGQTVRHVASLRGEGLAGSFARDTFAVEAVRRAELLFVIDDSCSMADKQARLMSAAPQLIQAAQSQGLDLSVGVIVTDIDSPTRARLRRTMSGAKFVVSGAPNAGSELTALMNVGTGGGHSESCLEPTNLALSDAYRYSPTENAGFLREDSRLDVVCFSDAPDQSPYAFAYEVAQLSSVRPRHPERFSYNVIGPFASMPTGGCSYDDVNTPVHAAAAARFAGATGDICDANFGGVLVSVFQRALSPPDVFTLTRAADASASIEVRVNGVVVPPTTPGGAAWTWDAATNRIRFEPLVAPEAGTTVTVNYVPLCF